jgi:hypothetical protein
MSSHKEAGRFGATERRFQLHLPKDIGLATALRIREESFSADVLPRGAALVAPSDFYAAIAFRPTAARPGTEAERARLFPDLAA